MIEKTHLEEQVLDSAHQLSETVNSLTFPETIAQVYNPLQYAWEPFSDYIRKYATSSKQIMFLGMNPGPWGMAQVGIPFGEVQIVKDWLHIEGNVSRPVIEHPKRPIDGFGCSRSEVSGRRLWGLFKERFGNADVFFKNHLVSNYCPLVFMEASGRNLTPDKLKTSEQKLLFAACDKHLRDVVQLLEIQKVIGVGKFAYSRASHALEGLEVKLDWILHPSPASPAANRDWSGLASKKLTEIGVW